MTLSATPGTLVRVVHNATASLSLTSVPANALIALFCVADANNGNAAESLSIGTTAGLTWTRNVQANGGGGAVAAIFTAPSGAGGNLTVTVVDSDGMANASAELGVQPVVFTDTNGGVPGTGATGGDVAGITTTVDNSWVWFTHFAGGVNNGTQTIIWASTAGGFNGGDTVSASKINAPTPTHGTTVTPTTGGAHDALIEITPGIPAGAPAFVAGRALRRRVQSPRRRKQTVAKPPAQVIVPPFIPTMVKPARTIRGRLPRRGDAVTPVPPQVIVPPTIPTKGVQPRRLRGLLPRRGKVVAPVPAQIVIAPPAFVPSAVRRVVHGLLPRRGRTVQVVPTQIAPPVSVWSPQSVRVRVRAALVRRGRVTTPPATDARPPLLTRLRTRLTLPRRGRTRTPVPPQVVVAPPAYPPQPVHRTRRGLRRRTHNSEGWMVGGAAPPPDCTTPRPNTGSTTRPGSGVTAYSTATTARPSSGTTARPNSGTTEDPCG